MTFVVQPRQLLLVILAGWLNREQQALVEYLGTENQILKETLGTNIVHDERVGYGVRGNRGAVSG